MLQRIQDIELELSRTQKNKATEHHLGMLKAKLARYRAQLMEGSKSKSSGPGEGFDVMKSGDARVAMIGFPSVGKSTLLSTATATESLAAAYEFTTLTCIPGVLQYKEANIQLLDLPGIIEGAAKGKGRGRQVISTARTADMILMMLDAEKAERQKELLTYELESVGIRLNQRPPDISIRPKKTGGVKFTATCECTHVDEKLCQAICQEYKIHNVDILFRENATVDQLIDVLVGNRKYMRCLYVVNKCDTIYLDEVDKFAHQPHTVVVSIKMRLGMDYLLEKIWEYLAFIRVYTKPRGKRPDFTQPLILRSGSTVEDVCHCVHRDFAARFKYALVWGTSAKHQPQRVGLSHKVEDGDVITLFSSN